MQCIIMCTGAQPRDGADAIGDTSSLQPTLVTHKLLGVAIFTKGDSRDPPLGPHILRWFENKARRP